MFADDDEMQVTMSDRRFWVGGNWKMNGSKAAITDLVKILNEAGETKAGSEDDLDLFLRFPIFFQKAFFY